MPVKPREFWDRAIKHESGCWNWDGCLDRDGYGQFQLPQKRLVQRAHRIAWILINGEIPNGVFVCHTCDNRKCINPNHLFLGSAKDNNADRKIKNRSFRPYGNRRRYGIKDAELPYQVGGL